MRPGQILRGARGDLTVSALARRPGSHRVYNIAVESDHVFYAGNLSALVHNTCPGGDAGGGAGSANGNNEYREIIRDAIKQLTNQIKDLSDFSDYNTDEDYKLLQDAVRTFRKVFGQDP
jgi:hypothetical protein